MKKITSKNSSIHKIATTLDPLRQVTFTTKKGCLGLWRRTLLHRYYVAVQNIPGFDVTWQDQDKGGKHNLPIDLQEELRSKSSNLPQNEDLALTKVTIFFRDDQRLKITIYYTTNKVLVQGKSCFPWATDEFQCLKTLVEELYGKQADDQTTIEAVNSLPLPAICSNQTDNPSQGNQSLKSSNTSPGLDCSPSEDPPKPITLNLQLSSPLPPISPMIAVFSNDTRDADQSPESPLSSPVGASKIPSKPDELVNQLISTPVAGTHSEATNQSTWNSPLSLPDDIVEAVSSSGRKMLLSEPSTTTKEVNLKKSPQILHTPCHPKKRQSTPFIKRRNKPYLTPTSAPVRQVFQELKDIKQTIVEKNFLFFLKTQKLQSKMNCAFTLHKSLISSTQKLTLSKQK